MANNPSVTCIEWQKYMHYHLMDDLFSLQPKTKLNVSLWIFITLQGCILIGIIFEWVYVFISENVAPIEMLTTSCPQNTSVNHSPVDISVGMRFKAYDLFQHCELLCQFHLFVFYNIYDLLTIWACSFKTLKMGLN